MKFPAAQPSRAPGSAPTPLKRRGLLLGVGAAGAAALAAKTLPGAAPVAAAAVTAAAASAEAADGYQVTAHVLRYYETTRV